MAQWIKDPALPLLYLLLLQWLRLDPWPGNSECGGCGQKKKGGAFLCKFHIKRIICKNAELS